MRKLSLLIMMAGLFLSFPIAARADFSVLYPDDVQGLAVNFDPGLNVVAMINSYGDVSTIHSDGFSDPVLVSLAGLPVSRAMWLFFLEVTPTGAAEYALYVDQGAGFFFVDNVIL